MGWRDMAGIRMLESDLKCRFQLHDSRLWVESDFLLRSSKYKRIGLTGLTGAPFLAQPKVGLFCSICWLGCAMRLAAADPRQRQKLHRACHPAWAGGIALTYEKVFQSAAPSGFEGAGLESNHASPKPDGDAPARLRTRVRTLRGC